MKSKGWSSQWLQQIVFTGPATLAFAIIVALPFFMGMFYSITDWNGVGGYNFVGFDNFSRLFHDQTFINSFKFTVKFTIAAVILSNLVGFLLALLLTQPVKSRNVLRTIFFMPNVIGGLLLGFIWQFIFVKGFTAVGDKTGWAFFNLPWLGDEPTAFWGIVIVTIWSTAGYLMVIYISALINVPRDLIEAASIDGATAWQRLRHITVPLIMPAVTIALFLALSWSFKSFDIILSLTKGGPYNSTQSVALNIYNEAFQNNNFGYGTAKALVFFIVVALLTSLQVYLTKRREVQA
ncbi:MULTISPECIES: sugar ABC transporter permease [unclassified Paenibacillus]|uniref:carbohydrate ABC transporter permease n=1 Tax=unclassified Paenibacillus TaxID=185978 RepID=UPI0009564ED1|nr:MULTISPECIES: sugar ABC transporter permease [unclassified Paenibacillus]ASS66604.1 sugar ABC transporter permease [Paenibacillus sp. RUD330]SIQ01114.1 raffinose/stachyose/melibiose transport system permease protein [Paenibacillus sp. RU4X]SIQ20332.1 raffinose/stachyose/melibiose transport system permease protein [Paenibacillus sp. RU4T]